MNKKIIETIFESILSNTINKCFYQNKFVRQAFEDCAEKYGLEIVDNEDNKIAYTLKDYKHNVTLEFSKQFINEQILDFKNEDKNKYPLNTVFKVYDGLPDKIKHNMNLIRYVLGSDDDKRKGQCAWSNFLDEDYNYVSYTIVPHYIFKRKNGQLGNYEKVLAHEGTHNYDYYQLDEKTFKAVSDYLNLDFMNNNPSIFNKTYDKFKDKFEKSNSEKYTEANKKNNEYLIKKGIPRDEIANVTFVSDHAIDGTSEEYADVGAMVITGFYNPNNPNSVVELNGRPVQYKEWIVNYPYLAQYMVKEVFDEDVSIDYLLQQSK